MPDATFAGPDLTSFARLDELGLEVVGQRRSSWVVRCWRATATSPISGTPWIVKSRITVQRVLTDNGSCYRSKLFAAALGEGVTHKRTLPYRPQTNGKVERFNRTLLDEWAYARLYRSEAERVAAFPVWLHTYNHHRGHTALGGATPTSRVTNLSGQNS